MNVNKLFPDEQSERGYFEEKAKLWMIHNILILYRVEGERPQKWTSILKNLLLDQQ
jgi:hypothetical protein